MRQRERGWREIATDPDAFEAFYRRHVEGVTRFLARRVDDPHTVADLVADVFLAVLDSAHTYRSGLGSEVGWLYGVARNTLSAERRRAARELRLVNRIGGSRLLDADDVSRMEDRIDAESPARRAIEAMAGLSDKERAVLELVAIDQLSIAEAAAALGIREGTAGFGCTALASQSANCPASPRRCLRRDLDEFRGQVARGAQGRGGRAGESGTGTFAA